MNILKLSIVALVFVFSATSCREQKGQKTVIIKEETKTVAPEENKGILERVGDAVDNRVNKEIDEEIEKIED